jgi:hypothetical protein
MHSPHLQLLPRFAGEESQLPKAPSPCCRRQRGEGTGRGDSLEPEFSNQEASFFHSEQRGTRC